MYYYGQSLQRVVDLRAGLADVRPKLAAIEAAQTSELASGYYSVGQMLDSPKPVFGQSAYLVYTFSSFNVSPVLVRLWNSWRCFLDSKSNICPSLLVKILLVFSFVHQDVFDYLFRSFFS